MGPQVRVGYFAFAMANTKVAAFYRFASFPDFREWREPLLAKGIANGIRGTILLAPEGLNGTISGPEDGVQEILQYISNDVRFADLPVKYSTTDEHPFRRWRVRLKKEIVTMQYLLPKSLGTETHVDAAQWNEVISSPETLVIDVRNEFEVGYGTFPGAVDPKTKSFTDFKEFVEKELPNRDQKLAIFCTGGIRCEKAAAYLAEQGFDSVVQLGGGILKYLETIPPDQNQWEGECFVFDEREALDLKLNPKR